jgi:hypothetical protein
MYLSHVLNSDFHEIDAKLRNLLPTFPLEKSVEVPLSVFSATS